MQEKYLRTRFGFGLALLAFLLLVNRPVAAQEVTKLDTTRVYELESVVVTANRSEAVLSTSTAAVSVLRGEELEQLPLNGLADAIQQAPGFAFVNLDGLGYDPQAMIRGFYGGGETEYLVVMLNGRPLNNVEQGLFNWNLMPLNGLSSIEILKGGASSLYGDAAIGGVVNLVTKENRAPSAGLLLSGGSFGSFMGQFAANGTIGTRAFSVFGDGVRTDGFREHAQRTTGSFGGTFDLLNKPTSRLTLTSLNNLRSYDIPGPLTQGELDESRTQGATFYRFDKTDERVHRLGLDGQFDVQPSVSISAAITGEVRHADLIRTLPLSPDFADTKNREVDTARLLVSAQTTVKSLLASIEDKLIVGVDASISGLDTKYYKYMMGGPEDYRTANPSRGELDTKGTGSRNAIAIFGQYDVHPLQRLRLSLGARYDHLSDEFEPQAPSTGDKSKTSHSAFSPKAGLNITLVQSARHLSNLYANVSQSFRAPTLDQLFDQRTIPIPFPPYSVSISNSELKPQYGTSGEVGLYHRAELKPGSLVGELSLAAYQVDMNDELDFNIEQFRYVNIGKSRHRGIESGAKLHTGLATLFFNYTLQNVTLEYGENKGKYVKAIPRDYLSTGLSLSHATGLSASLTLKAAQRVYLDDANTITLPNYSTVDFKAGYNLGLWGVTLEVFNVFDEKYSTTGFPDPAGTGLVYLYPAASRSIRLGFTVKTGG